MAIVRVRKSAAPLAALVALAACATAGKEAEDQVALYQCVMHHGNFAPRPRLPLVVTATETSFEMLVRGSGLARSTYAAYLPHYDVIVLSPRADRATLAHEFAHALGARHDDGTPNIALQIEREVRRGTACPAR